MQATPGVIAPRLVLCQQAATHAYAALLAAQHLVAEQRLASKAQPVAAEGPDEDANVASALAALSLTGEPDHPGSMQRDPISPAHASKDRDTSREPSAGVSKATPRSTGCSHEAWSDVIAHAEKAIGAWEAGAAPDGGLAASPAAAGTSICGLPDSRQLMGSLAHMIGLQGSKSVHLAAWSLTASLSRVQI